MLDEVARALEHVPPRQRRALEVLAMNGWLLLIQTWDFARCLTLRICLKTATTRPATRACVIISNGDSITLQAELCESSPTRAHLLKAAFSAHRRGEFALSVPVFLAQADGICSELIGVSLYTRRDGKPKLAHCLTVNPDQPFEAALCTRSSSQCRSPLRQKSGRR